MVPACELHLLSQDLELATHLGDQGRALDGYRILDASLAALEALPHCEWLPLLVERYRRAMTQFAQVYGLAF